MRMILRLMTAALMTAAAAGAARADIVLGVAGPMSGPNAAYGEQYLVGVETAAIIDGRQPHSVLGEIFTHKGIGTEVVAG